MQLLPSNSDGRMSRRQPKIPRQKHPQSQIHLFVLSSSYPPHGNAELIIKKKKKLLYYTLLCYTIISQYYDVIMYGIFIVITLFI